MDLFLLSFWAWILTILAPCVLPILPIIIGGSIDGKDKSKPYIVIASLWISILFFTLILKATTAFIKIPTSFWSMLSWGIVLFFWIITLFPNLWVHISYKLWFEKNSHLALEKANKKKWILWSIFLWAALGPVFSSCSPTFLLIISIVLKENFFVWFINIILYILWLSFVLFLIVIFWQKIINKLKIVADSWGLFKKILWIIFIIIWFSILFWLDKKIEGSIVKSWILDWILEFEENLLEKVE